MEIDIRNSVLAANAAGICTNTFETVFNKGFYIDSIWQISHEPNREVAKKFCDRHLVKVLKKYGYKVNISINPRYRCLRLISLLGGVSIESCSDSKYISDWVSNGSIVKIR